MLNYIFLSTLLIKIVHCADIWQNYEFDSGVGNREEIFIERIIAQENIGVNGTVQKWKGGINCPEYAVGIGAQELTILNLTHRKDNETLQINANQSVTKDNITDAVLFVYYNYTIKANQIILVLAASKENSTEIKWYKLNEKLNMQAEYFWSWHLQNHVTHMTYTEIENKLIIIGNSGDEANIDVFQFSLANSHHFSVIQTIPLVSITENTALNFDGSTIFLSLPQKDHVRILKYYSHSFIPYKNITCTFVEHVTAFHIGINSYLAIDGWNAGIYKFAKRTLVKQEIEHGHLEGTNYWLPIPINTYHNEEILLVQKNVSHDSFDSLMLELISKDGDKFSFHEETICDFHGDSFVGLNCITDENHNLGIKKSVVLSNGDSKALVLSHSNGSTTIFKINIGYKDVPSPVNKEIEELKVRRKRIEEAINQFKITNKVSSQLRSNIKGDETDIVKQNLAANWNLQPEKLVHHLTIEDHTIAIAAADREIQKNAVILQNRRLGHFDTIIVNGLLEVHGESRVRNVETNSDFEKELEDIARISHISKITGHKEFLDLQSQNISFESVNGIDASAIKHKNEIVKAIGDFTFEKPITVNGNIQIQDGLVNGANLKRDVVFVEENINDHIHFNNLIVNDTFATSTVNKFPVHNNYLKAFDDTEAEPDSLQHVVFEKLFLPGNLTVKYINNIDLDEFLQSLCFKNLKTYMPGRITINGKTTLVGKSFTKSLNDLEFPSDYVLKDSEDFSRFTGEKHFKIVQANEATTTYLNEMEPEDIVTLSQDQNVNGKFIFDHLEIGESISVDGKITAGSTNNSFIANPTMVEVDDILANVNFKSLEIEGKLIVLNSLNGSNFEEKMQAVIYKDQDKIILTNPKQFVNGITVETNLEITSNIINQVNIYDLVSKSTNEELYFQNLAGNLEILNLQLQGLINNCNITKLDGETVKLSGDQFLTSKFTFAEEILVANTLDIRESISDFTEFDLLFNDGNRILDELNLEDILAERIIIEKDIQTNIESFDLEAFEENRLSYSKDQFISGTVEALAVDTFIMNASIINDHSHFDLFNSDSIKNKILDMFFSEALAVQNLIVEETLNLTAINEVNLNELFSKCIWKSGSNIYREQLVFLDNVLCNNLFIENFNSVAFDDFVSNIVYKNETDVILGGLKNFVNGFHVKNYIDSKFINNIKVDNILRKSGNQTIRSPIEIFGDVVIENAQIAETVNGVLVNELIDSFEIVGDNTIKLNGDVMFSRYTNIHNLDVKGFVNGRNITEIFNEIVNINENMQFPGTTIFEDLVHIKGNMDVLENVNEVNMEIFNENVVCISNDAEFEDLVTFGENVNILQKLYVETDFVSRFVNGIDMQTWMENAVFINRGIIPGIITFDNGIMNGNLMTKFINGLNVSTLIPLRTNQNLDVKLKIDQMDVFSEIVVENLVNGIRLELEVAKSVLTDQENTITSEVIFENNLVVREELTIAAMVNNKNLDKIITTNSDQIILNKMIFSEEIILEQGLASNGFLNDINLTDWEGRGFKKFVPYVQNFGQPIFAEKITFDENVIGTASVNKIDARTLVDQAEGKKILKSEIEEKLIDGYPDLCIDVNLALKLAKQQLYSFDYLEQAQVIDFETNIKLLHKFEHQGTHYLLVHEQNSCTTNLLNWSTNTFYYIGKVETGIIHQIISIPFKNDLFLVSRSDYIDSQCNIEGSNIWKFEQAEITFTAILNIENLSLLQESQLPATFYGILKDVPNIMEYKLVMDEMISLKKYRRWEIRADNIVFIPRGLNTGMAVIDGTNIYRLMKDDPIKENDVELGFDSTFIGKVVAENNTVFPGRNDGEMVVLKTGEFNKNLMVAVTHKNSNELHHNIKIYDDWKLLTLYQEIQAINPSSLMTINFENNGESLLYFLEDNRKLRMFEYKGILGFLERLSADIEGTQLTPLRLIDENNQENNFISVVDKKRLKLFNTIMRGTNISAKTAICELL